MNREWVMRKAAVFGILICWISQSAMAVCLFDEAAQKLDQVEVGYCESDAVFMAKVTQVVESMSGVTAAGSDRTDHYHTQTATLRVLESFKGSAPEKVTTVTDLKTPEGAYSFSSEKSYLVFAKQIAGRSEYTAAGACSIQPTLPIDKAKKILAQLRRNKSGREKIDCGSIRPKKTHAPER